MNQSIFFLWIISVLLLFAAIIWLVLYLRIKRQKASFPVMINYVRRDNSLQGPFLYLELEMKNRSGKSIFVSEIQQRNITGPLETFLLQDAQGNTKRSLFEIREHFQKKLEVKNGASLFRYYQLKLKPAMMNTKLFLQYRAITTGSRVSLSNSIWKVPSELEQMPFKPKK